MNRPPTCIKFEIWNLSLAADGASPASPGRMVGRRPPGIGDQQQLSCDELVL